jgi:DNA replication initiation complex subunit (GINS family)
MKISYDELRRIHRLEKNTSQLVDVEDDFIDSLGDFILEEKKRYLASLKDFSSSNAREFANMKRVVEEIFLLREKKILNKALIASKTNDGKAEKMATQELEFFKKLLKVLEGYEDLSSSLFGESEEKDSSKNTVCVKILKEVPSFVGTDMKEYGPYREGEQVELPPRIAKLLVSRKIAEEK